MSVLAFQPGTRFLSSTTIASLHVVSPVASASFFTVDMIDASFDNFAAWFFFSASFQPAPFPRVRFVLPFLFLSRGRTYLGHGREADHAVRPCACDGGHHGAPHRVLVLRSKTDVLKGSTNRTGPLWKQKKKRAKKRTRGGFQGIGTGFVRTRKGSKTRRNGGLGEGNPSFGHRSLPGRRFGVVPIASRDGSMCRRGRGGEGHPN